MHLEGVWNLGHPSPNPHLALCIFSVWLFPSCFLCIMTVILSVVLEF